MESVVVFLIILAAMLVLGTVGFSAGFVSIIGFALARCGILDRRSKIITWLCFGALFVAIALTIVKAWMADGPATIPALVVTAAGACYGIRVARQLVKDFKSGARQKLCRA